MNKKMKKGIAVSLCTMSILSAVSASAAPTVYVNGKKTNFENKAYILNDRTMVPFTEFAKKLDVKYVVSDNEISVNKNGIMINLTEGTNDFTVNGATKNSAVMINPKEEEVFVPVRFISEYLGYGVEWNAETEEVKVSDKTDSTTYELVTDNSHSNVEAIVDNMKKIENQITAFSDVSGSFNKPISDILENLSYIENGKAKPFFEIIKEYCTGVNSICDKISGNEEFNNIADKEKITALKNSTDNLLIKYTAFMDTYGVDKDKDLVYWKECRELLGESLGELINYRTIFENELTYKKDYLRNCAEVIAK